MESIGYKFDENGMLSDETPLSFTYLVNTPGGNVDVAVAIQADMAAVGIDMQISEMEWNVFLNDRKAVSYTHLDVYKRQLVGTECYWFYTEGKPLAQALVDRFTAATGREARGVFYNYFYVTRSNLCPAVLLETGFVSSPTEYQSCAGDLGLRCV